MVGFVPVIGGVPGCQHSPVGGVENGVGSNKIKIIPLCVGGQWQSVAALVIAVGSPHIGTGTPLQGWPSVAIAGCHSGDGREEVTGFWPSISRR